MTDKYICGNFGERIYDDEFLLAAHPFDEGEKIYGCPRCKGVEELYRVCDQKDCWLREGGGINTAAGYRNLCLKHLESPRDEKETERLNKVLKTIEDNKP